jgi:hypothetical protein
VTLVIFAVVTHLVIVTLGAEEEHFQAFSKRLSSGRLSFQASGDAAENSHLHNTWKAQVRRTPTAATSFKHK